MGPDDERDGLEKRREHAPGEHTDDASHASWTTCVPPSATASARLGSFWRLPDRQPARWGHDSARKTGRAAPLPWSLAAFNGVESTT